MIFFCFFLTSLFAIDLRITEVFVDGSDEWLELTNIETGDFLWPLSLNWVKSSPLQLSNISIPAWSSLLIGDNLSMLSSFEWLQILTGRWLSLWDTSAIAISLFSDGLLLDDFLVDQSAVQSYDNQMTSFHKQRNGLLFDIITTISSLTWWVNSSTLAHPWRVYLSDGSLFWSMTSWDTTQSWSVTEFDLSGLCDILIPDKIHLNEIYSGYEYWQYIEFLSLVDYYWSLSFSGDILWQSLVLPTQVRKANTRYILTNSMSWFHHAENIIVVNDFSLKSSWSLILSDNELLPLDVWIVDINGQSVYKSQNQSCIGIFDNSSIPSPWFDDQFLPYMNTIYISWTSTQCDQDDIINNTGWNNSWQLDIWYQFSSGDVRISLIDYDPVGSDTNNERIGLTSFSGDINLSWWKLSYDGKNYVFQSGFVLSWEEYIRTANYVFVNSRPICISLYYTDKLIDIACYDPSIMSSPVLSLSSGNSSSETQLSEEEDAINYNNLQFDILQLDYDPVWSDTDNEKITLQFLWWYSWVVLDNLRVRVWTTNKRIYGTLSSGQTITLIGNFQMPNSVHTCVALTYGDIVYDEYCYNPTQASSSSTSSSSNPIIDTLYSNRGIKILWLNYDPDGSDTDRETVTLSMTGWQWLVDLSYLYLRFGSTKRSLKWFLYSDTLATIMWNYQLPNSKPTCIDLMEGSHIFDTYCYDPNKHESSDDNSLVDTWIISQLIGKLMIETINYDPPGKDASHESITLTWYTDISILTGDLSIRFNNTTRQLIKNLILSDSMIFSWNYGLPNTKSTCVELLYWDVAIDEYCYNPLEESEEQYNQKKYYQWLQLDRILPNPEGKDLKNNNEKIALSWSGWSGQTLPKHIKIIIGNITVSFSWYTFIGDQLIVNSPKSLTNQPACARLLVDDNQIDILCYPQAGEWIKYYHPRLHKWPETIPSEIINILDAQGIDIGDLLLKKIDKKICLTYNTIQIRCINSGESSTSKKNKNLLTLANAYISNLSTMVSENNLDRLSLKKLSQSYQYLSQQLKSWKNPTINIYGTSIQATELDRYIELIYDIPSEEYIVDQFSRILFWHEDMDNYYDNLY